MAVKTNRAGKEEPSVSFHYLARFTKSDEGKRNYQKFSQAHFDALCDRVAELPELDLNDSMVKEQVRSRLMAPLGSPERVDTRTLFGSFEGAYSGHSYRNTHAGDIPATSISLRKFYYVAYLTNSGRIYLGAQYLGHFGGYEALQKTFKDLLGTPETISSHAVRVGGAYYAAAQPKEVKVTFSKKAEKLTSAISITDQGIVAFKKQSKGDGFESVVREKLLFTAGGSTSLVKKAVAELTKDSDIVTIDEETVRDCTIMADFKGRRRTIYMLEAGVTASKLPLTSDLTTDGHPIREECKHEMLELLASEIIPKTENV